MALTANAQQYVDLGLPSGTLWKDGNESTVVYTYMDALDQFGDKLPTLEQFQELKANCTWTWTGKGYKVTGANGNSIILPVTGSSDCDGTVSDAKNSGSYWSSTPYDSKKAWFLGFGQGGANIHNAKHCYGRAVRLVKNK